MQLFCIRLISLFT